ncbi:MAG: peptidoglycan recognition protein family protein [Defluviitaleaceae bacterium]|nr:peptidoglycan recognition protein family protein [Defluviitaleaceae bacterium]
MAKSKIRPGFFKVANLKRMFVASFFGTHLAPQFIRRAESPSDEALGGFDYLVDAEYFNSLVEQNTGLKRPAASVLINNGQIAHERVIQQLQSMGHNLGIERQLTDIDRITVHHTVSGQNPSIASVNNWWTNRSDGSVWTRAGYHFLIRGDGSIWQLVPIHARSNGAGNPLNVRPSPNIRSIHIAFAGDFRAPALPTQEAIDSFGFLCELLLGNSQLTNLYDASAHIVGHRMWRNGGANDCPGVPRTTYLSWV